MNILLLTDSYKVSHYRQYPPTVTNVFSYFESRTGSEYDKVVFFGLQRLVKEYLEGQVVTREKIEEAAKIFKAHFGSDDLFNRAGWEHILEKHDGRLPVVIRAVPEGTVVPVSNLLLSIENTDPKVPWLTNYLETLLCHLWHTITVATYSAEARNILLDYLEKTGDPSLVDFKLHDFGFRGVSSVESAGAGGLAHLLNFMGTDTMEALVYAKRYYNEPGMPGSAIPAAEHSTMTSWGEGDGEVKAYENMLDAYPSGLVAVVSDSWDIFKAVSDIWGGTLRDKVMSRNGCLVIRPDSGDPATTSVKLLELMGEKFGYTTNSKGFKILDPHVRMIWGDGIDNHSMTTVLENLKNHGWSADNIAFGSGGALLQKHNRDTCRFAFKCSSVTHEDGHYQDVFKRPATDPTKNSKRGRPDLYRTADGSYETKDVPDIVSRGHVSATREVFRDGKLLVNETFSDIKARLHSDSNYRSV